MSSSVPCDSCFDLWVIWTLSDVHVLGDSLYRLLSVSSLILLWSGSRFCKISNIFNILSYFFLNDSQYTLSWLNVPRAVEMNVYSADFGGVF